jgi:hypothetical protein
MIWAEDAICYFKCRVVVWHLYLLVPNPTTAFEYLIASGEYAAACSSVTDYDVGLLAAAPRLVCAHGDGLPIALLKASDWPHIPPLILSREPQFPTLDILLSSLLETWLQEPYSDLTSRVATWIVTIYDARGDPALMTPTERSDRESYLALSRAIPARLRQLHVDMVHERVFLLAYSAYKHYLAMAKTVDLLAASNSGSDPLDVPPPSVEEIGRGTIRWCVVSVVVSN